MSDVAAYTGDTWVIQLWLFKVQCGDRCETFRQDSGKVTVSSPHIQRRASLGARNHADDVVASVNFRFAFPVLFQFQTSTPNPGLRTSAVSALKSGRELNPSAMTRMRYEVLPPILQAPYCSVTSARPRSNRARLGLQATDRGYLFLSGMAITSDSSIRLSARNFAAQFRYSKRP